MDEVTEPHENQEDICPVVKVYQDQGEGGDAEADLKEEEGKVASDKVEVSVEGSFVVELPDIGIKEVDGEGRRQDVDCREDEGQHWNICPEVDAVFLFDGLM